ncbi:hypothetical protein EMIHUDRAFT_422237 [Emiliania huxleyi CCMP1516]|uniref:Uncharacterized protein n=2 Tax=Emiliania huxleyi TaxID=2903 RepID=A0A0D3IJ65_EMIH1|nr:hypothetical protein EMIHUDRAFT_422237 [Emiliania huxleyi CCMP1516]EOD11300.1 hypothetical protein EMIHUDRAFT_422237 [Emiliania huxleyi CCMP1516]|eukprot:XP_005763729.1 hypothetical protein EMIHUDRAFT_422237 [Emiliania huxleyi CCMP1516]
MWVREKVAKFITSAASTKYPTRRLSAETLPSPREMRASTKTKAAAKRATAEAKPAAAEQCE